MKKNWKDATQEEWIELIKERRNTIWSNIQSFSTYADILKYKHFPSMTNLVSRGDGWKEFVEDIILTAFEDYFEFLGSPLNENQKKSIIELTKIFYNQFNILDLKLFVTNCKFNKYRDKGDRFINCPMVMEWFQKYLNDRRYAEYELQEEEEKRKYEEELSAIDFNSQEVQICKERALQSIETLRLGEITTEEEKVRRIKKKESKIRLDVIRRNEDMIGDPDYETKINQLINDALEKAGITKTN